MRKQFAAPDLNYRGLDLWMLNGKLDDEEIRYQMREMKKKGFYTVIPRTYNGLESDYPGPDFMNRMRTIIHTAKEIDMRIVLQAGYMPAAVRELPGKYALCYIDAVAQNRLKGDEKILCIHDGIAYIEKSYKTVLNMFAREAVDFYVNWCYGEMWEEFACEFGKSIYSIWVDEPCFPPQYIPWSPEFAEQYRKKWGCDILRDIYQLYVNEGDYKELRCRFRLLMQEQMEKAYYMRIHQWCNEHGLKMSGHLMAEETTCYQIENAVCGMPYYKYFDLPGVDFLGCMLNWSYDGMDGERLDINRQYSTPLQCMSAAHQAGKRMLLCEMYGVTSTNLTFRSQKHIFDQFAAFGYNIRCCHGLFYSTAGFRKRFYPHQVNYYEPYWEKYNQVNDYCARVGQFVSFGQPQGDILVIHPMETAFMLHEGGEQEDGNQILKSYDCRMTRLLQEMFAEGLYFEYGDLVSIRENGSVNNSGCFQIGEMQYRTVILPYLETLNQKAFDLLSCFREQGGRVIVLGNVPDRMDGTTNQELKAALSNFEFASDIGDLIRKLKKQERAYELVTEQAAPGFIVNYRKDEKNCYYMIHDYECGRATKARLCMKGRYQVFSWNAADGTVGKADYRYEDDKTAAYFTVPEGGSILLSFEKADVCEANPPVKEQVIAENIDGGWLAARDGHKNLLMLDFCRVCREGETEFSQLISVFGINDWLNKLVAPPYRGMITLAFEFVSEEEMDGLQLIIEEPEVQEIRLNNEPAEVTPVDYFYSKEFKIINLCGKILKGKNVITLKREYIPAGKKPSNNLLELFINGMGSEIEPIYLYGDFKVNFQKEVSHSNYLQTGPYFSICKEDSQTIVASSYSTAGYPFYVGDLILSKTIEMADDLKDYTSVRLVIGELHACVGEVLVNGRQCGDLLWEPFEAELLPYLKAGDNQIEIRLKTTLRNMIGPHHYKLYNKMSECSHESTAYWKSAEPDWMLDRNGRHKRWEKSYLFCDYGVYHAEIRKYKRV